MGEICRHQGELVMMDVLGELNDSGLRRQWQEHLKSCESCRRERERMRRFIDDVRRAGTPPELSPAQEHAMAEAVGWRLKKEGLGRPEKNKRNPRLIPALAGAAFFVAVVFGGTLIDRLFDREGGGDITAELDARDLEVINHLDFLKNMETIEKLIHVVDIPSDGRAPDEAVPETQGMLREGGGTARA